MLINNVEKLIKQELDDLIKKSGFKSRAVLIDKINESSRFVIDKTNFCSALNGTRPIKEDDWSALGEYLPWGKVAILKAWYISTVQLRKELKKRTNNLTLKKTPIIDMNFYNTLNMVFNNKTEEYLKEIGIEYEKNDGLITTTWNRPVSYILYTGKDKLFTSKVSMDSLLEIIEIDNIQINSKNENKNDLYLFEKISENRSNKGHIFRPLFVGEIDYYFWEFPFKEKPEDKSDEDCYKYDVYQYGRDCAPYTYNENEIRIIGKIIGVHNYGNINQ